jgi:hypothetical protein
VDWYAFARAAVAVVLLSAAAAKLASGGSTRPFLAALGVPDGLAGPVSAALPAAEAVCAVLLLAGSGLWAVLPAAALTVGFAGVLGWAAQAGISEGCRCFGAVDASRTPAAAGLLRALVLAAVTVALAVAAPSARWALPAPALLTGALAGWVYIGLFAMGGQVWMFERERAVRKPRLVPTEEPI